MKKVLTLILSFLLVSCFTEPKKENQTESINETREITYPEKVKSTVVDVKTIEEAPKEITNNNNELNTISNEINKSAIVDELNKVTKNSSFSNRNDVLSFLNKKNGLMLFNKFEFKLEDVYAVFLYKDYDDGYGAFHVSIECIKKESGSNCMYDTHDPQYISASIFPLQTKEGCLKYVQLFNSLNN